QLLVLKRIMMLREGHGAGVKPAVQHLRYPVHVFAAVRTFDSNCIDIRTVKLYRQRIGIAALFCQFGAAADGLLMAALTLPDIQGSTPVTVPGDGPVLDILQPVAKTSLADGFRDP